MKAVHKETGLSETKIRKILITEGLYSSELGDEIQRLYESGVSFEEICKKIEDKKDEIEVKDENKDEPKNEKYSRNMKREKSYVKPNKIFFGNIFM